MLRVKSPIKSVGKPKLIQQLFNTDIVDVLFTKVSISFEYIKKEVI